MVNAANTGRTASRALYARLPAPEMTIARLAMAVHFLRQHDHFDDDVRVDVDELQHFSRPDVGR